MDQKTKNEIESLSQKIEYNTATLADYKRYESILLNEGLHKDYIFSYLNRAGFTTWEEFIEARQKKENKYEYATLIGGVLGLGLGLMFKDALIGLRG